VTFLFFFLPSLSFFSDWLFSLSEGLLVLSSLFSIDLLPFCCLRFFFLSIFFFFVLIPFLTSLSVLPIYAPLLYRNALTYAAATADAEARKVGVFADPNAPEVCLPVTLPCWSRGCEVNKSIYYVRKQWSNHFFLFSCADDYALSFFMLVPFAPSGFI
jgi:hypothetical protein